MTGEKDLEGLRGKYEKRPGHSTSVHLSTGDYDAVVEIMEHIGCGRSEAIRTAIRVYWALINQK